MEFAQLYQFVGPPITRGPPPLPLTLIPRTPRITSPLGVSPASLFPPPLPSAPASRSKKYNQRLKPHHHLKPKYTGLPTGRHSSKQRAQRTIRSQLPPLVPDTFLTRMVPPEAMGFGGEDEADFGSWSNGQGAIGVGDSARLKMSEIECEYRPSQTDPLSGEDVCGDHPSIWATVLDLYPQFVALDAGTNAAQ